MRRSYSLRRKLMLWLGGGVGLVWLGAAIWSLAALSASVQAEFDQRLRAAAEQLMPLAIVQIFERESDGTAQIIAGFGGGSEAARLSYVVQDDTGMIQLASRGYQANALPAPGSIGWATLGGMRTYSTTALRGKFTITVQEPMAARDTALWAAGVRLLLPLFLALPLSLVLISLVLRRETAGVAQLNEEIARRGHGDLTPLPDGDMAEELRGIAASVNALMARLDAALRAERRFAANAAHELRTPVAAALAQAQRLEQEAEDPALRERGARISESLSRLGRLSEKLLQLSRAESAVARSDEPQDLGAVVRLVVDELKHAAGGDRIALELPDGEVRAAVNMDAYAILFRNLVENAMRHGDPDRPVRVRVNGDGAITVENEAPPVPPETLARLAEPFQRGPTLAEGSGLGLSIARVIAESAGGELELSSPIPGKESGFRAAFRPA